MYRHSYTFRFRGEVFSFVLAENKIVHSESALVRTRTIHTRRLNAKSHRSIYGATFARIFVIQKRNKLPHSLPVSRYDALNARSCWTVFCLWSFLLFQMQFSISLFSRWCCCSFCMRFASFIAVFGDVSFGCHTMFTQMDLFAFYRSRPEMVDFPTNAIICPMSQFYKLHCISIDAETGVRYWSEKRWHQIRKFRSLKKEKPLNKMFGALHSAKFIFMEIDKICKSKFTGIFNHSHLYICTLWMHTACRRLFPWHILNAITNHEIAHKLIFLFSNARDYE